MEKTNQFPSLIKITAVFALVNLTILLPLNIHGRAQSSHWVGAIADEPRAEENLPATLMDALSRSHGDYESLINQDEAFSDLLEADIVLIGEAHFDHRDMQTAFEIIRLLTQRRKVALAVERFPLSLQPRLEVLHETESEELRENEMRRILQTDDYQTVWGSNPVNHTGSPDTFDSSYLKYPSTEAFEAMVLWAARARIPIIGLDLPLSKRALGLGEDIPYTNELWKNQILDYLEKNQSENYLIVAIGGIDHFSNAPDSVQAQLRKKPSTFQLLSIGQRDANYSANRSLQVEDLALVYKINDLIFLIPKSAVVLQSGNAIFPTPPDYWIAVHSVDSWEK